MAKVTYVRDDGERRTLDVPDGTSLMAAAVAMLDTTACERRPGSRLSCQLVASAALDGIVVHTPETQL
jgi:ferredoxin, 2Fe-2S